MVERQVKEQRLARDGLESRGEVHEAGLLGDEGRVQAEGLKPLNQGLEVKSQGVNQTNSGEHSLHAQRPVRACTRHSTRSPQISYDGYPHFITEVGKS